MMGIFRIADRGIAWITRMGVIGSFITLFCLLMAGVVTRALPFVSISGYDEIIEFVFAWMTFLGALALWREGALYSVDFIQNAVAPWMRRSLLFFVQSLMLVFALVLTLKGWEFVIESGETTPFLNLNKAWWYASLPVPGAIMAIYSAAALWQIVSGREVAQRSDGLLG
jgi:TRAP-type C4-dicarboxylate transport system permease small subunit